MRRPDVAPPKTSPGQVPPEQTPPAGDGALAPLIALLCLLGIFGSALGGAAAGWIWAAVAAGLPAALLAASSRRARLVAGVLALTLAATIVLVLSGAVHGLTASALAIVGLWLVPLIATSIWAWRRP